MSQSGCEHTHPVWNQLAPEFALLENIVCFTVVLMKFSQDLGRAIANISTARYTVFMWEQYGVSPVQIAWFMYSAGFPCAEELGTAQS